MVNCVKSELADEINGEMWDTILVLKFQLIKTYLVGLGTDREEFITFSSLGGHYPQYMLIENYCQNIEG